MTAMQTLWKELEMQLAIPSMKEMAESRGLRATTILDMLESRVNPSAQMSDEQAASLINEIFDVWAARVGFPSFQELFLAATYINSCRI
jgi:hypothetical protein